MRILGLGCTFVFRAALILYWSKIRNPLEGHSLISHGVPTQILFSGQWDLVIRNKDWSVSRGHLCDCRSFQMKCLLFILALEIVTILESRSKGPSSVPSLSIQISRISSLSEVSEISLCSALTAVATIILLLGYAFDFPQTVYFRNHIFTFYSN